MRKPPHSSSSYSLNAGRLTHWPIPSLCSAFWTRSFVRSIAVIADRLFAKLTRRSYRPVVDPILVAFYTHSATIPAENCAELQPIKLADEKSHW